MAQSYGTILDPHRRLKEPLGIKGIRQSIAINNNPSTIDAESDSDVNATVVGNLGRAIIKKITIKLEGREVMSLSNSDIFLTYCDLWLTENERKDLVFQGIQGDNGLKHRVGAENATENRDEAVAAVYGNAFCIPLDFELLSTHLPYYQGALKDRLSYELTFNDYGRVIISSDVEAQYKISNITLQFDIVNHAELARLIAQQYQSRLAIYYERVLHHSTLQKSKKDTIWNFNLNTPSRSLKGILMLFEEVTAPFSRKSEQFYNPKIVFLSCTIEGVPNQVYASGISAYQHFDEVRKLFAGGWLRHPTVDLVSKDLHLHDVRLDEYLTRKYALWLDLRTTEDNKLHGSGRRIENGSEGININILKESEEDKPVNIQLFVVSDAQLNIEDTRLKDVVY